MNDILDRIQNEIKEEQKYNMFIKFFPYIAGIVVIFLLSFSIYTWRSSVQDERNEKATLVLFEFLQNNELTDTQELDKKLKSTNSKKVEDLIGLINQSKLLENNYNNDLLKSVKDLKLSIANKEDIFFVLSKEQSIINNIGKIDKKESIKQIDELLSDENIIDTMSSRLKALKMVLQHDK